MFPCTDRNLWVCWLGGPFVIKNGNIGKGVRLLYLWEPVHTFQAQIK